MDKLKQTKHDGEEQFQFVYPEPINRANFALRLPREVVDRELLAVIDVYGSDGANITSKIAGLNYSKGLDSWFRYIPAGDAHELREFAALDLSSAAGRVSIQLYDWRVQEIVPLGENLSITCLYASSDSGRESSPMTKVIFSNGSQILG